MFSILLSLLIASARAMDGGYVDGHSIGPHAPAVSADFPDVRLAPHYPGYSLGPSIVTDPGTSFHSHAPTINVDYNLLNSSLSDVRNVLSGRKDPILKASEKHDKAIKKSKDFAKAKQREARDLSALSAQMASSSVEPAAHHSAPDSIEEARRLTRSRQLAHLDSIPDPADEELPYEFNSPEGAFRDQAKRLYKDLYTLIMFLVSGFQI